MAGADYRSCDVCGGKAFYDANLNYDFDRGKPPIRSGGSLDGLPLDDVGDWSVLCTECAKTHRTVIVADLPIGEQVEAAIRSLQILDEAALVRAGIERGGTTAGAVERLLASTLTALRGLLEVPDGR